MSSDSVQGNLSGPTGLRKAHRVQTCHLLNLSLGDGLLALGLKKEVSRFLISPVFFLNYKPSIVGET